MEVKAKDKKRRPEPLLTALSPGEPPPPPAPQQKKTKKKKKQKREKHLVHHCPQTISIVGRREVETVSGGHMPKLVF